MSYLTSEAIHVNRILKKKNKTKNKQKISKNEKKKIYHSLDTAYKNLSCEKGQFILYSSVADIFFLLIFKTIVPVIAHVVREKKILFCVLLSLCHFPFSFISFKNSDHTDFIITRKKKNLFIY